MKKAILKSLMMLAAVVPTFAWSATVYQNPLAGSDRSLELGGKTYCATSYTALTELVENEAFGNFDEVIKKVGGDNDTQTHSFSMWVKVDELSDDKVLWWVCGGSNGAHGGYAVKSMSDGTIRVGKAAANGGWHSNAEGGDGYRTTTASCLEADKWAYLTVVITKTDGARTVTPEVYVNGESKALTDGTFNSNLNGNGGESTYAQIGSGISVAGVKVYNEAIASTTIIADYADRTNLTPAPTSTSATIDVAEVNASEINWNPELTETMVAELTATVPTTVTLDEAISTAELVTLGEKIAFAGDEELSLGAMTVTADTDVSGITASLGNVTIAAGKTLVVKTPGVFTSLTGTTTSIVETTEDFILSASLPPENMPIRVANGTATLGNGDWTNRFIVAGGATLDLNGKGNYRESGSKTGPLITLEDGATLKSSVDMSHDKAVLNELALAEGATVLISGKNFRTVAPGYGKTALALNGGTLNIRMDDGSICHFYNMCAVKTPDELTAGRTDNPPEATDYAGKINLQSGEFYFLDKRALFGRAAFVFAPMEGKTVAATISVPTELGSLAGETGTLNVNNTFTVGALNTNTSFGGALTGTGAMTKVGTGTLTFKNVTAYDGTLTVEAGAICFAETDLTLTKNIVGEGTLIADGMTLNLSGADLSAFSGTYEVKNGGTLILPAGAEGTKDADGNITQRVTFTDGNLILQLNAQQIAAGYSANITTGSVTFYDSEGQPVDESLVNGNTYVSSTPTWVAVDVTSEWMDSARWSGGVVPESGNVVIDTSALTSNFAIQIPSSFTQMSVKSNANFITSITFAEDVTPAPTITVLGRVAFAHSVITSSDVTFSVADDAQLISNIGSENVTWNGNVTSLWNFGKMGSGTLTLTAGLSGSKKLQVIEGILKFNGQANGNYQNAEITIDEGAMLLIANNNGSYNPVCGSGTLINNGTFIYSSTSATQNCHLWTTMSGSGKVVIEKGAFQLHYAASYSGGTEIAAAGTLIVETLSALGTAPVSGSGTLDIRANKPTASIVSDTWTGTVKYTAGDIGNLMTYIPYLYNENSVLELNGCQGYITSNVTLDTTIKLSGTGLTFNNGSTQGLKTVTIKKLTGDAGYTTSGSKAWMYALVIGDATEFSGSFDLSGEWCEKTAILIGSATGLTASNEYGNIVINTDGIATIAANKMWTPYTDKAVKVLGRIGGGGTISGNLSIANNATIDTRNGILNVTGTVTLPTEKVKIILSEVQGGEFKVLSAPVFATTEMPIAEVYVGDSTTPQVVNLIARENDGLYLDMAQLFTRTFDGTTTTWVKADAWALEGSTSVDKPTDRSSVQLTMAADTVVTATEPIHLTALNLLESGNLTLDFNLDYLITDEDYRTAPHSIELLRVINGFDVDRVNVWTSGLKYGATASIRKTTTAIIVTITLPDSMISGYGRDVSDSISINFNGGRNDGVTYPLSGTEPVGLAGYQVSADKWSQFDGNGVTDATVTLAKADGSIEMLEKAFTYTAGGRWTVNEGDLSTTIQLLRGYLDDHPGSGVGSPMTFEIAVPDSWEKYTAVIYVATDNASYTFTAKTVNGITYSYINGELTANNESPWGTAAIRSELVEGSNTMVIPDLSGDFEFTGRLKDGTVRACIAAIQVFKQKPIYDLELAPDICKATVNGDCTWETLEWTPHVPTITDIAELTLTGNATLNITNCADVLQVSVVGRNYDLALDGEDNPDVPWAFNADTILAMKSEENVIPANMKVYPGVIRYDYFYANDYTTIPNATVEFAAGFTGAVTPAGGEVNFSGGTVTLTQLSTSSIDTGFVFSGTSRTAATSELCFGQATVRVCDSATVASPKFTLSDGAANRTTAFIIEDDGMVNITGATNVHTGTATNSSSVKIAHWPGNATLTLSDNGRFVAENADMVLAYDGRATVTLNDNAEVRVKGLVHHHSSAETSSVILNGGKLLIGETGIRTFDAARGITLAMNGGTFGALVGTVELGADAETALANVTASDVNAIKFASESDATLHISAANSSFLQSPYLTNLSGGLRLEDATLASLTLDGGTLEVAGALTVSVLPVADGATIAFDGGVLTADTLTFAGMVTLKYPVREQLSAGGYIVLNNNAAVPNLSNALISLVLDTNRNDAEKLLPEYPLIVGSYTDGATPTVRGTTLSNNTNNAVDTYALTFKSGDLGNGLYVKLTGNDILGLNTITLTATSDYTLRQTTADAYPYFYFTAKDAGARVLIPESGVALSHITFSGEPTTIKATSSEPSLLLQSNHISFATDVTFDLSAWAAAMPDFICGAVADVPTSVCLISSGITVAPNVDLTHTFGSYELPEGFEATIEATTDGVYLVVEAERAARTVSVNFTHVDTPLVAPPETPGAYSIPVESWNNLHTVFSSTELMRTDLTGVAVTVAKNASGATQLLVYNSRIVTSETAPTSMLKAWLNDSADQEIQIQNIPFDAYRLALIFSNDLEGAAYAPITIGDNVYCMDAEGYLRKNIEPYSIVNKSNGLTTLEIPGDTKWGSTNHTTVTEPFVLGQNILVTDVLTDPAVTIALLSSVYDVTYSGLAAIQVIEAPTTEVVVTTDTYSHTFDAAGDYALAELPLILNETTDSATWVNSTGNTLKLTSNYDVVVTLPEDFMAQEIILAGSGKITLQVEYNGGAHLAKLTATDATHVTVWFDCTDVEFAAPSGVMTFERSFNNKGGEYEIKSGATLVLGEAFGGTTSLDVAAGATPTLAIANASAGILRRNYEVEVAESYRGWKDLTLAFKSVNRAAMEDNSSSHLLVEAGDTLLQPGAFSPAETADTWYYTQTGGYTFFGYPGIGGFLPFKDATDASPKTAVMKLSGGELALAQLAASTVGSTIDFTLSDIGILNLSGASFAETNQGTVILKLAGGQITTTLEEVSLAIPVEFEADTTVEVAPANGSTLVLNTANTGTGAVNVTQGTLAVAHASALAETTATIKGGATLELREITNTSAMANTVVFEEGATLAVTATTGTSFRIAGTHNLTEENKATVRYVLNGEFYSEVTVNATAGTVTFVTKAESTDVVWNSAISSGTWEEGLGAPWVDTKAYYNSAAVTFTAPTGAKPVEVTIRGLLTPSSINWDDDSLDSYRFIAANANSLLQLSGTELNMSAGQEWLVPVATAVNAVLTGNNNTYRLIGVLSNENKTASLVGSGNINGASGNHGTWCTDGAILAPQPGETQIVSAMAANPLNTASSVRSHMTGSEDVIITGGGTVQFKGNLGGGNTNVPYQNKGFSGTIIVQNESTLDFAMTYSTVTQDNGFFAEPTEKEDPTAGAPRYRGDGMIALSILNGGTVRFSGCRNVYGGWANRGDELLLGSRPIEVGYNGTVDYAYGTTEEQQQNIPYGFSLIGDGAKILASRNMWVSGGSTIKVAGIGDEGDLKDPAVDSDPESETHGTLLSGITAEIAGGENTGLVPWAAPVTASEPLDLDVGEGSTLNISALLTQGPGKQEAALSTFSLKKVGLGHLAFTRAVQDMATVLTVEEGSLGGNTTFSNAGSEITMATGTTLEAGLSVARLTLAPEVELKIDPTGKRVIYGESLVFTEGRIYAVNSLLEADEFPNAAGLLPIKIMGWNNARNVNAVTFVLSQVLTDKGYGLEVRKDGLYLKRNVVYVRELDFEVDTTDPLTTYQLAWYATKAWYLQDDPAKTPCDYAPNENDAVTALFILPDAYADSSITPPEVTLRLVQEVNFASIRFAVRVTETVDGEEVETLKLLPVPVIYQYYLVGAEMPGENEAKSFVWVPTLAVEREDGTWTASVEAVVPDGYDYTMRDEATVVVYASAASPAINVNFTNQGNGEGSWISADSNPCGVVPFAGVYWNNASTLAGEGNDRILVGKEHTYYRLSNATVVGVAATEEGQMVTTEVTYAAYGSGSVAARRGMGNGAIAAAYLQGHSHARPDADELRIVEMTDAGMTGSGWQVKVDPIPFTHYDLYLIFAAGTDETVRYPAVRIKVGDNDWCTYAMKNGWAAPSHPNDDWAGVGGLVDGAFVEGRNVLHFRFSAPLNSTLEIAPADNGQANLLSSMGVGLAALQIVECTDGVANIRVGTGKWSAATGWRRELATGTVTGRWVDATAEAPLYAQINTVSQLEADMLAQTPYLALSGSSTMSLLGNEGVISTGAVDLRNISSGTALHFEEDVFEQAPNVIMAPGITFTVPEGTESRTNMWRWVYDDATRIGDSSTTALFQKTGTADLTLGRRMDNNIEIQEGTLWLSTAIDGEYDYEASVTGEGAFGKTGPGKMMMYWNQLQTTGAMSGNVVARCNEGSLRLYSGPNMKLPDSGIILAEDGGEILLYQNHTQTRPFNNGLMKAVNGGTVGLWDATNIFDVNNRPSVRLESGCFSLDEAGYGHPHIRHFSSAGNSSLYISDNASWAWNSEGLVLWSGRFAVESGHLGLFGNVDSKNAIAIRATDYFGSEWADASYIQVAGGAILYSNLPIQGDEGKLLLRKIGAGTWIQTRSIASDKEFHNTANNGTDGTDRTSANIEIEEGTFRLNLGSDKFTQYPTSSDRSIRVMSGARMDGSAEISENTTIYIEEGATIASGAVDWVGISPACPGYNGMPAKFKQVQTQPLVIQGDLDIASDATLEVDLANEALLTVSGSTRFGGTLTVRLMNLPTALTGPVQLTSFKEDQVRGIPTITCPEAIALDAEVVLEDDNLWLKPSEAAYVWADQTGSWSDEKWVNADETDLPFIYDPATRPLDDTTPVARVQAATASIEVAVDKGNKEVDGRKWAMKALVLSADKGQTVDLVEKLNTPLLTTLPNEIGLNTLWIGSTVWKLGSGSAKVRAPVSFYAMGVNSTLNVVGGDLMLTHPLLVDNTSEASRTVVPTSLDIHSGASLTYALTASEDEERVIKDLYDPLTQTITGDVTGDGAIIVDGAGSHLTLKSTADSGLDYSVRAGRLTLAGIIAKADSLAERAIDVAAGASLDLNTESALGWASNLNWTLMAGKKAGEGEILDTPGALIRTDGKARVRGNVTVVKPEVSTELLPVTFGLTSGSIDGDLTFTVPAGTAVNFSGLWETPADCDSGMITKRGAGDLHITGTFMANLPMTISEGRVCLDGTVDIDNLNDSATIPNWVVEKGAALVTTAGGQINLGDGALTIQSGAVLDLTDAAPEFIDNVTFEDASVIYAGTEDGRVASANFVSTLTANGVVMVNLDRLNPEQLLAAGTASYTLLNFSKREGSGVFQLAGNNLVKWAEAGWSLQEKDTALVLEAFGGTDGTYTWAGAATGEGNWGATSWVAPHSSATELVAWPEINTTEFPAVTLQDYDPRDAGALIPEEARSLDWSDALGDRTLADLRCSNSEGDYTLTASGSKYTALNIAGILLKTGTSKLTVNRPITIGSDGALNLLGGETHLTGALTNLGSGVLTKTVTLGGDAILRLSATCTLRGLLDGDGTGTIIKDNTGSLTLESALDNLKALTIDGGVAKLAATDQYAIAPEITLASGSVLEYGSKLTAAGEVAMAVNATEDTAPAGVFRWSASVTKATSGAPRLVAPADLSLAVPAVNIEELWYEPTSGHLILDPGHAILPETTKLVLDIPASEDSALWVGSRTDNGTDFSYAALTGNGLLSVEPAIDLLADMNWATKRVVTLKLDPTLDEALRTFNGKFSGGFTLENTKITLGLNVTNADTATGEEARFTLTNHSTATTLGALTVGEATRVEVTGTWAGDVAVAPGGTLGGSGTVASSDRTVTIPEGATLTASAYGKRPQESGSYIPETVPTTLTVNGTLALVPGSKLKVLARTDLDGKPWISTVETASLSLPLTLEENAKEVVIDVILDIEENVSASGTKILGWTSISGIGNITGRVIVNGEETDDYIVRQKNDGLYLQRSNARFWMILR